jgi:hypothetical protein
VARQAVRPLEELVKFDSFYCQEMPGVLSDADFDAVPIVVFLGP